MTPIFLFEVFCGINYTRWLLPVSTVRGGMAERLNAAVLKTVEGVSLPGVRIPLPPPLILLKFYIFHISVWAYVWDSVKAWLVVSSSGPLVFSKYSIEYVLLWAKPSV